MSSISAGTSAGTALVSAGDTTGELVLKTNGTTTAVTIDTAQRVAFVAGTAALPAITTAGDTNTGIFFPAADTIAFAEGGAEVARFDSSGNLGIGTSSPSTRLHLLSASNTQNRIETSSNGSVAVTQYKNAAGETHQIGSETSSGNAGFGGSSAFSLCVYAGGTTRDICFGTNGTERMRINADGGLRTQVTGGGSIMETFGCRAWVNFNGTGTPGIRASGNVSSITDNGTGLFTVNFTTAMPDTNYAVVSANTQGTASFAINIRTTGSSAADAPVTYSTTQVSLNGRSGTGTLVDPDIACVAIFR